MQDDHDIGRVNIKENAFIHADIFERITDAFMAVDENFCYTYVNKKAGDLFNREPSSLIGKNVWEEFPSSVGRPVYKAFHQAMGQQAFVYLEDYYPETGCWIEHHIYPSTGGISIYFRDITDKKKMEIRLKQSDERYRLLFEQSHDGIFIADFEGNILEGNSEACKMSGYTKEELLTKTLQDLTPKDIGVDYPLFFSLMRQGTFALFETQLLKKDDSRLFVEVSSQMTSDGTIAMFSRDITSRKIAEMGLRKAEEKYRLLFEQSHDGIFITDEEGKIVEVNTEACKMSGYTKEELLTKTSLELTPEHRWAETPELIALIKQGRLLFIEGELLKKDASILFVEISSQMTSEGKIAIFSRDITDRKIAEMKLRQTEERYRLLFEQSHDGIFISDFEGNILEGNSNACIMSGYTKEELLTKTLQDLTPEYRRGAYPEFFSLMQQGTSILAEGELLKKDGSILFVEISAQMTADGRIAMFSRDITSRKIAEMELREAEEKFRKLVEQSLVGVYIIQDGKFAYVNPKLCEEYGFTQEELIGSDITITGKDEEEMRRVNENIRDRIEGKTDSVHYEMTVRRKDKTLIDVEVFGSRTMYKGNPAIIGTLINITERKKAELQLREAEQKFRDLAEKSLVCVYIIQDEKFVYVNPRFAEEYGFTREELIGMDIYKIIVPEGNERNKVKQNIQARLTGKVDSMHYEMKGLKKDSTVMDVEVFGSRTNFQGRPAIIGTLINITERKEAESKLRISEEKYKLMFESNPVPMWMFSKTDFSIIDVNNAACKLYGYSREEFLQMNIRDMRPEEDVPLFLERISEFQTTNSNHGVWRHRKKDGSIIHVEITGNDIIYQGREVRLALANNITEKLAAEERLKKSYEEIRQLTKHLQNIREEERTSIAREIHDELGQQLTVLKMDVAWVDRKLTSTDNSIKEKLESLMSMLDGTIKTVRRISSELRPSILDDLGLISAMNWHLKEFEKRSGIKTEFSKPTEEILLSDALKTGLFRILQESLTNVARHSAAKNVRVSLTQEDGHILLYIEDDGIGFNKEQVNQKRTLGILGMKERSEMMGGKYEITSAEGKGTMVIVNVPYRQP